MCDGLEYGEVAEQLNISERTVKYHVSNILSKTGYANKTRLAIAVTNKNLSSRGFRRIRATCNKQSEQPKNIEKLHFANAAFCRSGMPKSCVYGEFDNTPYVLQIALSDSAKRRQIMYNHTNPRSGFAAGLSRTAGNMRRTAAKTLSDARTKLGRKSKEKRRRAMRRIVVDMQNALFTDAIAAALRNFDSDFEVFESELPQKRPSCAEMCVRTC